MNREVNVTKLVQTSKAKAGDCAFIFPTSGCKLKFDFLDCLKTVAKRAKLDADGFWLHKFRATFATRNLRANVDLRTVQLWLGHGHRIDHAVSQAVEKQGNKREG